MALEQEPRISALAKRVADKTGMENRGFDYRMKTREAYYEKIVKNKYAEKPKYEIKDILRYTYISSPETLIEKTLEAIQMYEDLGYITTEIKNYWLMNCNPYNGINTVITAPNGLKFEVQYHTLQSYEKKERMHELYEEWRKLPETATKAKELNRKMFEGYQAIKVPKDIKKVK